MKVRIVCKPDYLSSGAAAYSVQKKYPWWPFWVNHSWHWQKDSAVLVAEELCDPVVWTGERK